MYILSFYFWIRFFRNIFAIALSFNKVSVPGDASHNFAFEIALSGAIMLTLLLVCAFSPRKYKSILRRIYEKDSLPGDAAHTALLKSHYCKQ